MPEGVATVTPASLPAAAPDGSAVTSAPITSAQDLATGVSDEFWSKSLGLDTDAQADGTPDEPAAEPEKKETTAPNAEEKKEPEKEKVETPAKEPAKDEKAPETEKKEEPGYYQDEQGKWHRPDGKFADADESAAAEEALTGRAPADPGEKKDAPVKRRDAPKGFTAEADDGTPYEEWPEITVSFNADGKEHSKVPLDKLVRLAQMGVYNERRDAENKQIKQSASQWEQEKAGLVRSLEEMNAMMQRAFEDEDYFVGARKTYQENNSPQAKLQRLEQQRAEETQKAQQQQTQTIAANYIATSITPQIEHLVQQYTEVPIEEVLGELTLLTSHLTVNGVVPPHRLPQVQALVQNELAPWVEARHESRVSKRQTVETTARKQVAAEKVKTALAKRQMARATAPQGEVGSTAPAPVKIKRAEDLADAMFGRLAE